MPVPAARMAVVERDVERAPVAAKHADSLRGKQVRFQCGRRELRKVLACEQKRAPRQVGPCEPGRGEIALYIRRGARPSGVAARNVGIVKTGEHPDQPLVVVPCDTELARFGETRLPDAHRILRVPARWKRQIREQGSEWRRKSLAESPLELRRQGVSVSPRDLHAIP